MTPANAINQLRGIAIDLEVALYRDRETLTDEVRALGRRVLEVALALTGGTADPQIDAAVEAAEAALAVRDTKAEYIAAHADPRPRTRGRAELAHHKAQGRLVEAVEAYADAKQRAAGLADVEDVRRAG